MRRHAMSLGFVVLAGAMAFGQSTQSTDVSQDKKDIRYDRHDLRGDRQDRIRAGERSYVNYEDVRTWDDLARRLDNLTIFSQLPDQSLPFHTALAPRPRLSHIFVCSPRETMANPVAQAGRQYRPRARQSPR